MDYLLQVTCQLSNKPYIIVLIEVLIIWSLIASNQN